jgi:hypothetical protein
MNLVFKAVTLASTNKLTATAVSSEAEARAWLTAQKRAFSAQTAKTTR